MGFIPWMIVVLEQLWLSHQFQQGENSWFPFIMENYGKIMDSHPYRPYEGKIKMVSRGKILHVWMISCWGFQATPRP